MVSSALLVDDDQAFLLLATRILNGLGIAVVTTARDAATAIAAAAATKADAVLVDVGLPDRNGIDLAYELAALPWAPRVELTSTNSDAAHAIGVRGRSQPIPFVPKNEVANASLRRLFATD